MGVIDKQRTEKIIKKLQAKKSKKPSRGPHDFYYVSQDGVKLTRIGLRRGSRKGAGHDHVSTDLKTTPSESRQLADCTISRAQWLDIFLNGRPSKGN